MLQRELNHVIEDRQKKIEMLESSIEKLSSKHQEDVAFLKKLLKEREDIDKQRENERVRECLAEQKAKVKQTHITHLRFLRFIELGVEVLVSLR